MLVLFLSIILSFWQVSAQFSNGMQAPQCRWTAPRGATYDLSSMRRVAGEPEFRAEDELSYFVTNVCDRSSSSQMCTNTDGIMCEYRTNGGSLLATMARVGGEQWALLEPGNERVGVAITYHNGDKCSRILPDNGEVLQVTRTTTFNIYCSEAAAGGYLASVIDNEENCQTIVNFHARAGCPMGNHEPSRDEYGRERLREDEQDRYGDRPRANGEPGRIDRFGERLELEEERHTGWFWITIFMIVCTMYLAGGYVYNNYYTGVVGWEALPHLHFWRQLPGLVTDGIYFSYFTVMRYVGGLSVAPTQGYNTIPQQDNEDHFTSM